jgi:hypothetical protein
MGHKVFISFKTENSGYRDKIAKLPNLDMVDKSLKEAIPSDDEEYIMRKIREDYLRNSTVTIQLIGQYSAEKSFRENQNYIKRELQASLRKFDGNARNGILGIVLPEMYDSIYKGKYTCTTCGEQHNFVNINDNTTISEFNYNYYLPLDNGKHIWSADDRYCLLVKWDDFIENPNDYIDQAYLKRFDDRLSDKVKVYPKS